MEFLYALRELLAERTRLILTLLAIAWGTLAISLMLAVGQGLLVSLTQFMQQMGSNLVIAMPGQSSLNFEGTLAGTQVIFNDLTLKAFTTLPDVSELSAEYSGLASFSHNEQTTQATFSGVASNYLRLHQVQLSRGRFINEDDIAKQRNVIVLGYDVAQQLFGQKDALNQSIQLGPYHFTIIGISRDAPRQIINYETGNNYLSWIPDSTFRSLFPTQSISYILVKSRSSHTKALQIALRHTVAKINHLSANDHSIVEFFDIQDAISSTQDFFHGLQWFLGALGAITLMIASLGIANIMYLAVESAIPTIGIRMALGASVSHIVRHYLIEALLLSFLGGLIGLIFCAIIIFIANLILPSINLFGLTGLHLSLSIPLIIIIVSILAIVGLASGIFPAMRAANINPVEALRHE